ncbi:hypothetical protein QEH59_07175 [Coraliomargarita sp. SDUM461004]|uniref:Twin-arginine translocation signal domain-containing protein n=1 Tax=Thalassobacterium sedimentorum TaxID=3041258 RepID=A0ABU1AK33_9BACT|nr:hypothetical protein [Coraliomargarita sp. SDUM461004]MDQ8194200.1 hypothetical protein [Coraliomargarita sp. SDUM461004]
MDSEPTTNRKDFLKRTGLAIAGAWAVASIARFSGGDRSNRMKTASKGATTESAGLPQSSAMARVRTAKGAVARKA